MIHHLVKTDIQPFPTDLPEPDDLFAGPSVVSVDGVVLPISQIQFLHATQHDLCKDKNSS